MSSMYIEAGDLGDVAEQCKSKQRMLVPHPPLTARGVFTKLHDISKSKGTKSAQRKQSIISGLLRASRCALNFSYGSCKTCCCSQGHAGVWPGLQKLAREPLRLNDS